MKKELSERKRRILQFIIQEYILTAEPIGSRTISKKNGLDVSAATIRNEMSDLEDLGLLIQPYTSAGRIPSGDAYKIYVSEMNSPDTLSEKEKQIIEKRLQANVDEVEDLLNESLRIISRLTGYTSIGVTGIEEKVKIRSVSLVSIEPKSVVAVLISEKGDTKSDVLHLNREVDKENLALISELINERLTGKYYSDIDEGIFQYIKGRINEYGEVLDDLLKFLKDNSEKNKKATLILSGAANMLNHPEFNNVDKAKTILEFMGEKENLKDLFSEKGIEKNNINIVIGNNTSDGILHDCSVITADYEVGKVGIIGPTRMNYGRVLAVMNFITQKINNILNDS